MPSAQKDTAIWHECPPARWHCNVALPLAKLVAPVGLLTTATFSCLLIAIATQISATVTASLQSCAPLPAQSFKAKFLAACSLENFSAGPYKREPGDRAIAPHTSG